MLIATLEISLYILVTMVPMIPASTPVKIVASSSLAVNMGEDFLYINS